MALYRGMDRAALDAAYNNGAAVKNSAQIVAEWEERSARLRAAHPEGMDLRYGPEERNRIDYFAARRDGPVLAFIHGGYWQMRSRRSSFIAEGPLAWGINVALIGYTLAPQKRLDGIVAEIHAAISWLQDSIPLRRRSQEAVRIGMVGRRASHRDDDEPCRGQRRPRDQRHLRPRADAPLLHQRQAPARSRRGGGTVRALRKSRCSSPMAPTSCRSYAGNPRTTRKF